MQNMSLKPQVRRIHIKLIAIVFLRESPLTQSVVSAIGGRHWLRHRVGER